ncbi:Structural maintenance of chromosomes protein 6, partial [Ascosphaera acerosa]
MPSQKRSHADEPLSDVTNGSVARRKRVRVATPEEVASSDDSNDGERAGDNGRQEGVSIANGSRVRRPSPSDSSDDDEQIQQYEQQYSQAVQSRMQQLGENSPVENGILLSVECVNFMCHRHFSVELGPLINFIVGKNGSGKSAILTAITLCLGGKASVTNRGQSLKSFIKEGEESATIIVRIKNGGNNAFRPKDYGDVITVERHFSRSGASGFRLKNSRGRIVSTKKSDLDELTDFFVLQIDNPMNVLSQDMARQFLSNSSPAEKYKFFVKGVQLEQLDQDYRLMEESVNQSASKLQTYEEELRAVRKAHKGAVDLQRKLDRHQHLRDQINETRKVMAWAIVESQQQGVDEIAAECEKLDNDILRADENIERLEQMLRKTDEKYEAQDEERKAAVAAQEAWQEEVRDIRARMQEAMNDYDTQK